MSITDQQQVHLLQTRLAEFVKERDHLKARAADVTSKYHQLINWWMPVVGYVNSVSSAMAEHLLHADGTQKAALRMLQEGEAAKAKLAELEKEKPRAYEIEWSNGNIELSFDYEGYDIDYVELYGPPTIIQLYARQIPATTQPVATPIPADADDYKARIDAAEANLAHMIKKHDQQQRLANEFARERDALAEKLKELEQQQVQSLADVEQLRCQLAGCGVAAMQNTRSSAANRAAFGDYGYSASYADVCLAVDREMVAREERDTARQQAAMLRAALVNVMGGDDKEWLGRVRNEVASFVSIHGPNRRMGYAACPKFLADAVGVLLATHPENKA